MRKDPAFLAYPADWLNSVKVLGMTLEQQGAYWRLLCLAWLHDGIPNDEEWIRRMLGVSAARFRAIWTKVAPCWVPRSTDPTKLVSERMEHEREQRRLKAAALREKGLAGASSRWGNRGVDDASSNAPAIATGNGTGNGVGIAQAMAGTWPFTSTVPEVPASPSVPLPGTGEREPAAAANEVGAAGAGASPKARTRKRREPPVGRLSIDRIRPTPSDAEVAVRKRELAERLRAAPPPSTAAAGGA